MIEGIEERFKELVFEICERNDYKILALECQIDHCHIFVNVPPTVSAAEVVKVIKTNTSRVLRAEFSHVLRSKQLWTRSYFASTAGDVSAQTIKRYIETQKRR